MWRSLSAEDSTRLAEFFAACRKVDGEDPISDLAGDLRNCPEPNNICAVSPQGSLVAAGWVIPFGELRIAFGGKVHPEFRRQGLGTQLMAWAEHRVGELHQTGDAVQLVITNEALAEDAHHLYMQCGFEQVLVEEMRVFDLSRSIPSSNIPEGISRLAWSAQTTDQFFQAYQNSFRQRPGFPNLSAQEWINGNLASDGFRPDLSVLAQFSDEPAGFLTAEAYKGLGWISQVGVVPAWRGQGLAKALIVEALRHFKEEGFKQVALHVNINNPAAINLYSQLGFVFRLTRARYVKEIKPNNDVYEDTRTK